MGMFQQVEGEAAVLVDNGVYKQTDVYIRNGYIYAKTAGGFVRLFHDGSTSKPKLRLDTLTWEGKIAMDVHGKLCDPDRVDGARPLPQKQATNIGLLNHQTIEQIAG